MRLRALVLLLILAAALPALVTAQDPPTPACAQCSDRGMQACKLCASKSCEASEGFERCSVALECGDCGGVRWRECRFCERPPELDIAAERARLDAWRATRAPIDEFMGRKDLIHVESAHFAVVYGVPRTVLKRAHSQHEAAHQLLDLLEGLHAEFRADTGASPEDFNERTRVMLWGSDKEHQKAASKWTLERTPVTAKLMGKAPVICYAPGGAGLRNEAELVATLVHDVAHCLLSNLHEGVWLGGRKGGWLDEGYAQLVELRRAGTVSHWCSLGAAQRKGLPETVAEFEKLVLERVGDGAVVPLDSVVQLNTVELPVDRRVFAWSYVDFLVRTHPGKLAAVAKLLQKEKPASEALKNGLGRSLPDLQLDWATWVKGTYGAKRR